MNNNGERPCLGRKLNDCQQYLSPLVPKNIVLCGWCQIKYHDLQKKLPGVSLSPEDFVLLETTPGLDTSQIARLIKLSPSTVGDMINKGKIEASKNPANRRAYLIKTQEALRLMIASQVISLSQLTNDLSSDPKIGPISSNSLIKWVSTNKLFLEKLGVVFKKTISGYIGVDRANRDKLHQAFRRWKGKRGGLSLGLALNRQNNELTLAQAAKLSTIPIKTIRYWINRPKSPLPSRVGTGRCRLITKEDLIKFLNQQANGSRLTITGQRARQGLRQMNQPMPKYGDSSDQWLTTRQIGRVSQISPYTLERWCRKALKGNNTLKVKKIKGVWQIDRESLILFSDVPNNPNLKNTHRKTIRKLVQLNELLTQ